MTDRPLSVVRSAVSESFSGLSAKFCAFWALIKNLQTGLLLVTGVAGYLGGRPTPPTWESLLALLGTLFLTVGGSTVLNMVWDRDIDAKMARTQHRPLASGTLRVREGLVLGLVMVLAGGGWALALAVPYGLVILAGVGFDVLVYTCWLKRRTPWSIIWGGIAGGMPVLAGRVLAIGHIDAIGLWLALAILLWIPTHIMTFSIKYADQYHAAGVPVFPNRYGTGVTRVIIGVSTAGAVAAMLWAMYALDIAGAWMWIARGLGGALSGVTLMAMVKATPKLNFLLYKLASCYMLGSMIVLIAGA